MFNIPPDMSIVPLDIDKSPAELFPTVNVPPSISNVPPLSISIPVSPASKTTTSPGTKYLASITSARPFRITLHDGKSIFLRAFTALSALYSCTKPITALIKVRKEKVNAWLSDIEDFKNNLSGQTISIHGKDYATVAHRLAIARRNLGSRMKIVTDIVSIDKDTVVCKAAVSIGDRVVATGLAEEKRTASRINQTSALENCETSAVGRALAFCGIINDGIASAEEVAAAIEQQDKKIQTALKALNAISHAGNFQKWISDNKTFLADLKSKNPVSYNSFLVKFTEIKNQLKSNGVKI